MRRSLLAALVALCAALAVLGVLLATGQAALVITRGVSMQPTYAQGDLVLVLARGDQRVGDVAAYRRPGKAEVVLHRIVRVGPDGHVFRGDNNASDDPVAVQRDQLTGRALLHVPQGGTWLRRLTAPAPLAAAAVLLLSATGPSARRRSRRRRSRSTSVSRHHASRPSLGAMPRPAVGAAVAGAGLLAAAVLLPASAEPPPSAPTATPRSVTFDYRASVPRSPAYDGTTVTAPDPVFRTLTDRLVVELDYRGGPAELAVQAEVSDDSGWRTTVPLAPARAVTAGDRSEVALDLAALQRRASAAAAVTRLPGGAVRIRVLAVVVSPGAAEFRPALDLQLTPLRLSLTGGAAALQVSEPVPMPVPARPSRGPLGALATTGAGARALGGVGLLLLLVGGGLLGLSRHGAGQRTAAGIRRRYASLLVRVDPMPAAPGRPVVDVADFAALARLADRHGLLVLHWHRAGVETFVVPDDSTTYRFRVGESTPSPPAPEPVGNPLTVLPS